MDIPASAPSSVRIAVVDDDAAILDALTLGLEGEGWEVQTYSSGEEFLRSLPGTPIDCLILDPHLPDLTGAEVARSVAIGHLRIPIIGLTARPNSPATTEVMRAGARVMLTKPATLEKLVEEIQAVINSSSNGNGHS